MNRKKKCGRGGEEKRWRKEGQRWRKGGRVVEKQEAERARRAINFCNKYTATSLTYIILSDYF